MTHNTDCTLTDEGRREVETVAEMYWNGEKHDAKWWAQDLGWEHIGGGVGRTVWRVPTQQQTDQFAEETPGIVKESPCIVKFATPGHRYNGKVQNQEEINQFERFPDTVTKSDSPSVVPLMEWDEAENLWISAPEVDPNGGWVGEARERLAEVGWQCDDLHSDNVGEMHGLSVVLDYGLECSEFAGVGELADEVKSELKRQGAANIKVEESGQDRRVTFSQPTFLPTQGSPPGRSEVFVHHLRGPSHANFIFGPFPGADDEMMWEIAEKAADQVSAGWWEIHATKDVFEDSIQIELEIDSRPDERFPAFEMGNVYDSVLEVVNSRIDDPKAYLEEVREEMEDMGAGFRNDSIVRDVTDATFRFQPDEPDPSPWSEEAPHTRISAAPDGFTGMEVGVGIYHNSRVMERAKDRADTVNDQMQSRFDDLEVEWRASTFEEIYFILSPTSEFDDEAHPVDIALLYNAVIDTVDGMMPDVEQSMDHVQGGLEDFIDQQVIKGEVGEEIDRRLG